ncbi:tetratricopeptide repeat protein [Candidatus Chlorohelix sp.]|uniref:tetratricopeptide repeat protein n=1 Tax=Candidatus Chlorohelix sp. TaxID=3139201 RepID=UPI003037D00D
MNHSDLLQEGISAVRSGNKKQGAEKLMELVKQDSRNSEAWFWLAAATDNQEEAAQCLRRSLRIDPGHTRAKQALESIEQGISSPASASSSMPPLNFDATDSSTQSMRPLNTGELLSGSMGFDSPYTSFSPTPAPRQEQPTSSMPAVSNAPLSPIGNVNTPPPLTGNEPTPPPPFGMPAWANQAPSLPANQLGSVPERPDPYSMNTAMQSAPGLPPPFQMQSGGTGLSFAQLDPAAAQAQLEAAAKPPQVLDPNADLRARLLGNMPGGTPAPPPPFQQIGQGRNTFTPDPNLKQANVQTKKKKGGIKPIYLLIAFLVIFATVAAAALLLRKGDTPPIEISVDNQTATAVADITQSPVVTTTIATTATITPRVTVTTTGAALTTAAATTPAASTKAATTATGANTTATSRVITTVAAQTTTTTKAVTTTPAPVTTTVAVPTLSAVITFGAEVPESVQIFVRDTNSVVSGLGFVDTNIERLMFNPFKSGKLNTTSASNNEELNYYLLIAGQLSRKLKDSNPPDGAIDLGNIAGDYANHITDMLNMIDRYKVTGQDYYMQQASALLDKSRSDRSQWAKVLAGGYPYKSSLS